MIIFDVHEYCYFAADLLETGEFIGFIGLMNQDFCAFFTPCVDIGWRLKTKCLGTWISDRGSPSVLRICFYEASDHGCFCRCTKNKSLLDTRNEKNWYASIW